MFLGGCTYLGSLHSSSIPALHVWPGICAFAALPPVPVQLPVDCLDKQPFEGPGSPTLTRHEQ